MINKQFNCDIEVIPSLFKKLCIVDTDGEKHIKGELDIVDSYGKCWDTYSVEIKTSKDYPYQFPKLIETANAFPKIADWHVYDSDGTCCIDVPPSEIIICKNGLNVAKFVEQFAIPYLANQSYKIREGYYMYGEYSHGILGRLEYYQSKLRAKNPVELIKMFKLILEDYNPDRTSFCPFCTKKKFRHCHRDIFKELSNVKAYIYNDGLQLIPFLKSNPDYILPEIN